MPLPFIEELFPDSKTFRVCMLQAKKAQKLNLEGKYQSAKNLSSIRQAAVEKDLVSISGFIDNMEKASAALTRLGETGNTVLSLTGFSGSSSHMLDLMDNAILGMRLTKIKMEKLLLARKGTQAASGSSATQEDLEDLTSNEEEGLSVLHPETFAAYKSAVNVEKYEKMNLVDKYVNVGPEVSSVSVEALEKDLDAMRLVKGDMERLRDHALRLQDPEYLGRVNFKRMQRVFLESRLKLFVEFLKSEDQEEAATASWESRALAAIAFLAAKEEGASSSSSSSGPAKSSKRKLSDEPASLVGDDDNDDEQMKPSDEPASLVGGDDNDTTR
jgi:hypothetical protein